MALVTVVGARGRQGLAQIRQLLADGHKARAVSRQPHPFHDAAFDAVEVVAGDLDDEGSLQRAFEGSDGVFFTRPLMALGANPVGRAARVGRAAKGADVRRVVFNTSLYVSDEPCGDPTTDLALAMENAIAETDVALTVFRPVLFMDNLLTNWARPSIVNEGRYVYAHNPGLEANWISLDDVAKFMIAALDREDLVGARMVIGGPERLRPPQVAEILSETLARPVRYEPSTPEEFGRRLAAAFGDDMPASMREPMVRHIAEFYRFNNTSPRRPFSVDMAPVLARIPIEMETMRMWAARQTWVDDGRPRPPAG
jgi:uncharacterized protein YbjT (DUF2867 family)